MTGPAGDAPPPTREPTRVTPYELAFGEAGLEERLFPAIQAEAGGAGLDTLRRDRFAFLESAARSARETLPPEPPPEALEQHRLMLFHAYNFWRYGRRLYLVEPAVARYLVEAAPKLAGWEVRAPHPTTYLQLPANLFWASIAPDTPPEPVDGFFVTVADGDDALGAPFRHLDALMVLGIRRNRAGFSVIPFETQAGPGIAAEWAEAPGREGGTEFESILPGGEMAGLYSILTTVEALKLLARTLWYIDAFRERLVREDAAERRAADRPGKVRFSRLPCLRVTLDENASPPAS